MGVRYPHQGTTKDGSGKIITSATVAVFLTGTSTPASIYAASAGGVAVNSVTSGADTSSAPGYFIFYVDRDNYAATQEFDITISKSGFNSQTYSFVVIDNATDYLPSPSSHKASHENGGVDEISVLGLSGLLADDQHVLDAEVQAIKLDDFATPDDNTDLNVSITRHGLTPKLSNDGREAFRGDGTYKYISPPQNLLPNSGFGVWSYGHISSDGSPGVSVTSHTIGATHVIAYTANTQNLAVGKQVYFDGSANASLRVSLHTITGMTTNVSFEFDLASGTVAAGGGACGCAETSPGGDIVAGVSTYACDKWTRTAGFKIRRILSSDVPTPISGSMYAVRAEKVSAAGEFFWYPVFGTIQSGPTGSETNYSEVYKFGGRNVVFGAWIYATAANGCRLFIQDDTGIYYSSYAPLNILTWVEMTRTIPAASTLTLLNFGFVFTGAITNVHYVSSPMLSYGTYLGQGNYQPIPNEIIMLDGNISPVTLLDNSSTVPANIVRVVNLTDETNGKIPRIAKAMWVELDATCDTAGGELYLFSRDFDGSVPNSLGIIHVCQVAAKIQTQRALVKIRQDIPYSWVWLKANAGGNWSTVTFDINAVIL